jgi:hypothetical protein
MLNKDEIVQLLSEAEELVPSKQYSIQRDITLTDVLLAKLILEVTRLQKMTGSVVSSIQGMRGY